MLWPALSGRFLGVASALLVGIGVCCAQTTTTPATTTKKSSKPKATAGSSTSAASHSSSASPHRATTIASHGKSKNKKRKREASWKTRGQQKIDPQRSHDIQEALIREHYMDGSPTGVWDDASQRAMQKYQADHGWQSVMTPDSRALIQLGLGPDHAHLLNPESAMTMPSGDAPHASEAITPAASASAPATSTPLSTQVPTGQEDPPKK